MAHLGNEASGREEQIIVLRPFLKPRRGDATERQISVFASRLALPELAWHLVPTDPNNGSRYYPDGPERGLLWHLIASCNETDPTDVHAARQIGNLIVATTTFEEVRDVSDEWVADGIEQHAYSSVDNGVHLAVHSIREQNNLSGQDATSFIRHYTVAQRPLAG